MKIPRPMSRSSVAEPLPVRGRLWTLAAASLLALVGLLPALTARGQEAPAQAPVQEEAVEPLEQAEAPGAEEAPEAEQVPEAQEAPEAEPEPEAAGEEAAAEEGAAKEAVGEEAEAEEEVRGRTQFQLPFPAEQGGGTATGSAGSLEFQRDTYAVLSGGVELRYQDVVLKAERAEVDLKTRVVTASGDVVIDQGPQRVTGSTALYDLEAKTGTLTDATAYVDPDIYFAGAEVAKIGEDLYTVTDGTFTSCTDEVPDWSFRVKRARVKVEGYAHLRGAAMRVKKVPVLYTPYLLWPAKGERASGFLVPQPGYSSRRGTSLSLAYFQTLGRSWDTTFYTDIYSTSYLGLGNELRWAPSEGSSGSLIAYAVRDPERDPDEDEWRYKIRLDHTTEDLPFNMRGALSYRDYSDFDFFRDFERELDHATLRSIYSRGFITGNWGPHSLNLLADDRETFISTTRTITQRRLPEVEYRLRATRLGKLPLYLNMESSLAYLDVARSARYDGAYGRFDLFPTLQLPLRAFPWLSVSFNVGGRLTWYGDSLCPTGGEGEDVCGPGGQEFTGESLSRFVPTAGVEVVGPSFSRIFEAKVGSFGKFKHIIEPRITYGFVDEVDEIDRQRTPLFDEVDTVSATNVGRFALVNRLLAKPADEEKGGSAREILLFELSQTYSFDSTRPLQRGGGEETQEGPIQALLRFEPSRATSLKAEASYNTLFDQLTATSLSGSLGLGEHNVGLTWFTRYAAQSGETLDDQVRLWGTVQVLPKRLELQAQLNYDLDESFLRQQRYVVGYTSQCYSFRLEVREFRAAADPEARRDRDYRLSISLKNVGTFLDLSGRQTNAEDF